MMEFIGYCNGASNKNDCAAAFRDNLHKILLPVNKNGWISTGKSWKNKDLYGGKCLTVIDLDVKKDENFDLDNLHNICDQTMIVQSGSGGFHIYFLIQDSIIPIKHYTEKKLKHPELHQIDIQSEGGIIFAPGSKFTDHKNKPYVLLSTDEPLTISTEQFNSIIDDLLKFEPKDLSFIGMRQGFIDIMNGDYKIPHIKDEKTGVDEFVIWKAFYRELHSLGIRVDSLWSNWSKLPDLQPEFNYKTAGYQLSKVRRDLLMKRPTNDLYYKIFPHYKVKKSTKKKETEDWDELFLKYWDKNYSTTMLWVDDWNKWVVYNNKGIFEKVPSLDFSKIVFDYLAENSLKRSINKVNLARELISSTYYTTLNMYDGDLTIRNVKNGLLHLDDLTLSPHTPEYLSLYQANANYLEPQDLTPTPCWDIMKKKYPINLLKVEWFLRCVIYNNMSNELALFIVGVNRSGKGSTIGLVSEMFPDSLTSHQSFESLGQMFGLSPMIGKNLNIDSEGTITKLNATAIKYFKTIVGQDGKITVNLKGVQQFDHDFNPFFFLFAMNQLYRMPGTDLRAFFSRVLIAQFSKQEKKPDPEFKIKLLKESDSVFSKLVHEGYEDFQSFYKKIWDKEFELDEYIDEQKELWEAWSNPIGIVCKTLFKKDDGVNQMDAEEITELVTDGLADHGYGIPANNAIKAQITKAFKRMDIMKGRSNGVSYYRPVRLMDDIDRAIKQRTLMEVSDE